MLIVTIVMSIQRKRISTAFEDIFLLIILPIKPPKIPEMIITARVMKSVSGIEEEAKVKIKLAV